MMAPASASKTDELLQQLPAVYQEPGWRAVGDASEAPAPDYLRVLLGSFARVFLAAAGAGAGEGRTSGRDDDPLPRRWTLEDRIAGIPTLVDPSGKPDEFLTWLGQWVALSEEIELNRNQKERLIAVAVPLYRIRGTRRYIEELLRLYLDLPAIVDEPEYPAMQVGVASTVGRDTYIQGAAAHLFRVSITAGGSAAARMNDLLLLARMVIDLAKPAHTWYQLVVAAPPMQIRVHSTVGVDTLLSRREDTPMEERNA